MSASQLQPATQALVNSLVPPGFFDLDPYELEAEKREGKSLRSESAHSKGMKPLLRPVDFILPELVSHAENGDLSIHADGSSLDPAHLEQIFRLAESAELTPRNFSDLPYAKQQLERRRYSDYLKREPKSDLARSLRHAEREVWESGSQQAEENLSAWFAQKGQRRALVLVLGRT